MEEAWTLWGLGFPLHKPYPYTLGEGSSTPGGVMMVDVHGSCEMWKELYWVWFVFWFYLFRFTGEKTLLVGGFNPFEKY